MQQNSKFSSEKLQRSRRIKQIQIRFGNEHIKRKHQKSIRLKKSFKWFEPKKSVDDGTIWIKNTIFNLVLKINELSRSPHLLTLLE